jgi:hypothetical protein
MSRTSQRGTASLFTKLSTQDDFKVVKEQYYPTQKRKLLKYGHLNNNRNVPFFLWEGVHFIWSWPTLFREVRFAVSDIFLSSNTYLIVSHIKRENHFLQGAGIAQSV